MADLTAFYADKILAELVTGYANGEFIADRAMPIVYSPDQTGYYQVFGDENKDVDTTLRVSPTSEIPETEFSVSKTQYNLSGFGSKIFVPNAKSEDIAGQFLQGAINTIYGNLLGIREKIVLDKILACGNTTSISTTWNANGANLGTVVTGVEEMQATLLSAVGVHGNVLIMGTDVWAVCAKHIANVGVGGTVPSTQFLASLLGLDEVLVSKQASRWTAQYAALLYRGASNAGAAGLEINMFEPSYGKTVYWTDSNLTNGVEFRRWDAPERGSHGGSYVAGTIYCDAVETMNKACTLADVLT
jgi:hypothetical protein